MCQLTIHFETPEKAEGKVYFLVFDKPENFGDESKAYNYGIVNPPLVTISLPYGEYAVTCFEDTKINGKMDKNLVGIPTEPVGTSDNPRLMGSPKWKDAAFSVNQPKQEITVKLKKIL
jgi:uncharacterized protein (DUF2141 family)